MKSQFEIRKKRHEFSCAMLEELLKLEYNTDTSAQYLNSKEQGKEIV